MNEDDDAFKRMKDEAAVPAGGRAEQADSWMFKFSLLVMVLAIFVFGAGLYEIFKSMNDEIFRLQQIIRDQGGDPQLQREIRDLMKN